MAPVNLSFIYRLLCKICLWFLPFFDVLFEQFWTTQQTRRTSGYTALQSICSFVCFKHSVIWFLNLCVWSSSLVLESSHQSCSDISASLSVSREGEGRFLKHLSKNMCRCIWHFTRLINQNKDARELISMKWNPKHSEVCSDQLHWVLDQTTLEILSSSEQSI